MDGNKKLFIANKLNDILEIPSALTRNSEIQTGNRIITDKSLLNNSTSNPIDIMKSDIDTYFQSIKERNRNKKYLPKLRLEFLLIVILIIVILKNEKKRKKENVILENEKKILEYDILFQKEKIKELIEKEKVISENEKKILEHDILFQKEKIKELQQKLNLKIETEKVFLEDLKKIKRSHCTKFQQEKLITLFVKANNLMNSDKKSHNLNFEYNIENQQFLKNLKILNPSLTNKELKLCIYFRMGLSSKEISILDDTTTGTVRVYKTRIKNKLALDKETRLCNYLLKVE
ncbi:helix-turn-helix transcriptional regulator [Chryseobacterium sp. KCF3-3]|uniref:helix-turn-helix transcriptional regulator n=1 Tax=Chryseobacterium sp. KCF3-3 TaxID=3231511 RepID=UPI0038B2FE4D